jgi:hypothetical protein
VKFRGGEEFEPTGAILVNSVGQVTPHDWMKLGVGKQILGQSVERRRKARNGGREEQPTRRPSEVAPYFFNGYGVPSRWV